MASAGMPAMATPCRVRSTRRVSKDGASGATSPSSADAVSDTVITRVRPQESATALTGTIARASAPVLTERVRLDAAGETANVSEKAGSSACTA